MRFETKVPMKKDMKIAVLIDAENISHKYAHTILQEASSLGNVIYKRIYGNWMSTQLGPWKKELLDHAIQPIQQFSNTTGKNYRCDGSALSKRSRCLLHRFFR